MSRRRFPRRPDGAKLRSKLPSNKVADAMTTDADLENQAPATFSGFSAAAMHTMRHIESLAMRNVALNCTEALVSALLLLCTLHSETSLGISERLLYIVSCTSSARYLWCAHTELHCSLLRCFKPTLAVCKAAFNNDFAIGPGSRCSRF